MEKLEPLEEIKMAIFVHSLGCCFFLLLMTLAYIAHVVMWPIVPALLLTAIALVRRIKDYRAFYKINESKI